MCFRHADIIIFSYIFAKEASVYFNKPEDCTESVMSTKLIRLSYILFRIIGT